jgi:hypothetical protein
MTLLYLNINLNSASKGVTIYFLARAAQAASFVSDAITRMIQASASVAAKTCESKDDTVQVFSGLDRSTHQ